MRQITITFIITQYFKIFFPMLHKYRSLKIYSSALCSARHILVLVSAQTHLHYNKAHRPCIFSWIAVKWAACAVLLSECYSEVRNVTAVLGCENPSQTAITRATSRHTRSPPTKKPSQSLSTCVRSCQTQHSPQRPSLIRVCKTSKDATSERDRKDGVARGVYEALRPPFSSFSLRTSFVFRLR